ncbi:unnamed protein product [Musa hybrid cultivar]
MHFCSSSPVASFAAHDELAMPDTDRFYCWLLQVFVLFGLVVFFIWLSLRISDPSYTIVEVTILQPNNGTADSTVFFGIEIANRNRAGGVYYSDTNVSLNVMDASVGSTTIHPFYQGHGKTAQVRGGASCGRWVSDAISSGATQLRFELMAAAKYKMWFWRSRLHRMSMQGSVHVGKDGKLSRTNKRVRMRRSQKKRRSRLNPRK